MTLAQTTRLFRDAMWFMSRPKVRSVTAFSRGCKERVRIARGQPYDARDPQHTYSVTVGKPNYQERAFLERCRRRNVREYYKGHLFLWSVFPEKP